MKVYAMSIHDCMYGLPRFIDRRWNMAGKKEVERGIVRAGKLKKYEDWHCPTVLLPCCIYALVLDYLTCLFSPRLGWSGVNSCMGLVECSRFCLCCSSAIWHHTDSCNDIAAFWKGLRWGRVFILWALPLQLRFLRLPASPSTFYVQSQR